jgi:hypothetical protein
MARDKGYTIPDTLALWPTPWWLRLLGYPGWRYLMNVPKVLYFHTGSVAQERTIWVYVTKE